MLLTRKSASAPSAQGRLARGLAGVLAKTIDRRTFLQAFRRGRRRGRVREPAAVQHDRQGRGRRRDQRRRQQGRSQAHRLHALLGRLRRRRHGRERRVGAAGTGVRFAAQPRRALRQGRIGARARHDREFAPSEVSDEAGRTASTSASPGSRRSTRSATSCSRSARRAARTPSSGSASLQAQQRAGLPDAQVRVVLSAPTTPTTRRASATRRRSPA